MSQFLTKKMTIKKIVIICKHQSNLEVFHGNCRDKFIINLYPCQHRQSFIQFIEGENFSSTKSHTFQILQVRSNSFHLDQKLHRVNERSLQIELQVVQKF
jgi:hypothetical protein